MGRRSRPRRHSYEKNTRSVDDSMAVRLRSELGESLPTADLDLRERLARTALLSRREAIRYLEASATQHELPIENVQAARQVIERLAAA